MLSKELLDLLVCPESKQKVSLADPKLVSDLNVKIRSGLLKNRTGKPITESLDGALIREDRRLAYPVRQGIPVMLIEDGIPLE